MADNAVNNFDFVSAAGLQEIDKWISKYPKEQRQSAVMSALMIIQEEHGYLTPELMNKLAQYLGMSPISVYEVANFYTMYELNPTGQNIINVCTNISCKLRGSTEIVDHLKNKLQIDVGQTTPDRKFTLRSVECLGACVNAPMMQVNKDYHENLTAAKVDKILEDYV